MAASPSLAPVGRAMLVSRCCQGMRLAKEAAAGVRDIESRPPRATYPEGRVALCSSRTLANLPSSPAMVRCSGCIGGCHTDRGTSAKPTRNSLASSSCASGVELLPEANQEYNVYRRTVAPSAHLETRQDGRVSVSERSISSERAAETD